MSRSTGFNAGPHGKVAELGDNVYVFGTKNQADKYVKTTEAIAEYVGREYNKAMRLLVKGTETEPEEPRMPRKAVEKKDENPFVMEKYKTDYGRYLKQKDLYQENKAKVFVIIKGQCSLGMKTKVEGLAEYDKLESDDDVIGLLKLLKDLAFSTLNAHYEYWTIMESLKAVLGLTQKRNQSLASYYRSWTAALEVAEEQYGKIGPKKGGGDSEADARNKLLACVFLDGADKARYGKVVTELQNQHLTGNGGYPESVEGMMTLLSHRTDSVSSNREGGGDGTNGSTRSFAQSAANRGPRCYKCGEFGHVRRECPNEARQWRNNSAQGDGGSSAGNEQSNVQVQVPWFNGLQIGSYQSDSD